MKLLVPTRGSQGDHNARGLFPVFCGGRGAKLDDVTRSAGERPVDTIAVARKFAEKQRER